jgi:phospholipid/cholesterol/gamma-HCH transport system substrate-binding protein
MGRQVMAFFAFSRSPGSRLARRIRTTATVLVASSLVLSACSFGSDKAQLTYTADFQRAIQVFPAVKVRVLGVEVGHVIDVRNAGDRVSVKFVVNDPKIKIPANVRAAVLPASLLGERSIQLFPAYTGGPVLPNRATIPLSRTAVPAEPDELLRALQDYLGRLDQKTVTKFVENAAAAVEGNGAALNQLIHYAANVFRVLSTKGDELAATFVQLNKLTLAAATRQAAIGRLIRNYAAVTGTVTANRRALEGTIEGLNQAALQLASLLTAHLNPLKVDVQNLTRTSRTLGRKENAFKLALTTKWATSLFTSAMPGVAYDVQHKWLRLNNQGEPLFELIIARIEQRLMDICTSLMIGPCTTANFFNASAPGLFCVGQLSGGAGCPPSGLSVLSPEKAAQQLTEAIQSLPKLNAEFSKHARLKGVNVEALVRQLIQSMFQQALSSRSFAP